MSGYVKFWYGLAWVSYALAMRWVDYLLHLPMPENADLERVHMLALGCFFLLLAIYHRGARSPLSE